MSSGSHCFRFSRRASARLPAFLILQVLLLWPWSAASAQSSADPWQFINRPVYHFNQTLDTLLIRPVAVGYDRYLPAPAKSGVRNFLNNLDDVNVLVNDLLQWKLGQALNDSGRLVLNTTVGLAGVFDPATEMGLLKNYEDFGQTLGVWGLGDGGYLMLPLFGASTVRDTIGMVPDYFFNPVRLVSDNRSRNALLALDMINARAGYLAAETMISGDEYSFVRNAYLQRREYLIADGELEDEFDDF